MQRSVEVCKCIHTCRAVMQLLWILACAFAERQGSAEGARPIAELSICTMASWRTPEGGAGLDFKHMACGSVVPARAVEMQHVTCGLRHGGHLGLAWQADFWGWAILANWQRVAASWLGLMRCSSRPAWLEACPRSARRVGLGWHSIMNSSDWPPKLLASVISVTFVLISAGQSVRYCCQVCSPAAAAERQHERAHVAGCNRMAAPGHPPSINCPALVKVAVETRSCVTQPM